MGRVISAAIRFIDGFTKPSKETIKSMQRMGNEAIKAGKQIQNAGKTIQSAGATMAKSITLPVAGIGIGAIKTAADFESAMSQVAAVSGATGDDFAELTKKAKEMGAKTKFSASESAEAMNYMAMAGWKTKDMVGGIEGIMNLAAASGEDLATTSDIVTDALTAFGMTAQESGRFADVLAAASSNANTNVSMMGETFKYCAPVAGALGYSVEDTAEAIGLMANSGIKASNAGTAMRAMLTNLQGVVEFSGDNFGKWVVETTNADGSMRGLNEILKDCREAFSHMTESEKAANAEALVGKTGMSGFLAVMNAAESDIKKLNGAITNSAGAAENMAAIMNDNLNGQITILKSGIEGIAISVGEKLLPYVKKAVSWVQTATDYINSLSDAQVNHIIKWAGIAAAIGPAIMVFGKVVTSVGTLYKTFGAITKTIANFGGIMGVITSPAGIVIGVLAAIAVAAVLVAKNWDKIKPVIMNVKEWFVSTFGGTIKQAISGFRDIFTRTLEGIKAALPSIIQSVKNAIQTVMPAIKVLIEAFKIMLPVAIETIKTVIQTAKPIVQSIIETLSKILPKVIETIKSVIKSIEPVIKTIIGTIVKTVPTITATFSVVMKKLNPVIKTIGNIIKDVIPVIANSFSKAFEFAGKAITKVMPIINKIISLIGSGITFAVKTVSPIIIKLVSAFSFVFPKIVGFVKAAATKLQPIFDGIGNAIKIVMGIVQDKVVHSFETVVNVISTAASNVREIIGGITKTFNGILDFIGGVFTGNWKKAWNGVKDIFGGVFEALAGMCKTPINAVIEIINGAISGINKINVTIPDWIPGLGGQSFGLNLPTIPLLYKGTNNWQGGAAIIHDQGGEIVDLPRGSRVYPHDKSIEMARKEAKQEKTISINIQKLADKIEVRSDEDIDRIAEALAYKLKKIAFNTGVA